MSKLDWEKANKLDKMKIQGAESPERSTEDNIKIEPNVTASTGRVLKSMIKKLKAEKIKRWLIEKNNSKNKTERPRKTVKNGKTKGVLF